VEPPPDLLSAWKHCTPTQNVGERFTPENSEARVDAVYVVEKLLDFTKEFDDLANEKEHPWFVPLIAVYFRWRQMPSGSGEKCLENRAR
jgi:hypothetical protein